VPNKYSTLFACLYDQPEPVGNLGRGTHYSVFRSVEWLDVMRKPLLEPHVHDFAVLWDEDHDTRVIPVIEQIYMAGLLSPVQFIGERKGGLFVVVAAKFGTHDKDYISKLSEIAGDAVGDSWHVSLGMFDRQPGNEHQNDPNGIVNDKHHAVVSYLTTIDALWKLGTRPFNPGSHSPLHDHETDPPAVLV
jgi:hypothetical protein